MFSIIEEAGWPIWLLLVASVVGLALIIERMWYLRSGRIIPKKLLDEATAIYREQKLDEETLGKLEQNSPLGIVFASALRHTGASRNEMRNAIEETGRGVAHQLERFLTTIGTIATLSPLMGLFGTVVGMIEIFGSQSAAGTNPIQLAHGISVALYNTGFGLLIAMPTLVFYRHFRALVDRFLVEMELQAAKLVDMAHPLRPEE
ncbi:MAG: MotA/TolQ/ExbB proton channel family protein [Burkholderiaceae bacterium]|nr:MotA/TolQ/ExbB proton channel family protein [Burkholderiaceae bacterium]